MKFFLMVSFLFFISCSGKNKVPAGILPQQEMGAVLWDLIRADEYIINFILKDSFHKKKHESIKLYEQVFKIHDINKDEFQKSLTFYKNHPGLLQSLLDTLESRKKREAEKTTSSYMDTLKKKNTPYQKLK